jgi:ABC-type sugar transport system ATPase subunit
MRGGRITGEFTRDNVSQEQILEAAMTARKAGQA